MMAPALEMQAHILLEAGEPERTVELSAGVAFETPVLRYLRALALIRLSPSEAARAETEVLLRQAESMLPLSEPAGILPLFALASKLAERGEDGKALDVFESISNRRDAPLYWPIPYVRSFGCMAKIRERRGDRLTARSDRERFLSYWSAGDIDRDRVEEALHSVKA